LQLSVKISGISLEQSLTAGMLLMKTIITICCMAAVLSAKDHIAAATKHITLAHAEYSIYFIMGWKMSIKLPLPIGDPGIQTPLKTRFLF